MPCTHCLTHPFSCGLPQAAKSLRTGLARAWRNVLGTLLQLG
jgi:hypothetical protein